MSEGVMRGEVKEDRSSSGGSESEAEAESESESSSMRAC